MSRVIASVVASIVAAPLLAGFASTQLVTRAPVTAATACAHGPDQAIDNSRKEHCHVL